MKKNIGFSDKIMRLLVAVVFIGLFISDFVTGFWAIGFLLVAGVLVITSLLNFCPLYHFFGWGTNRRKKMS